jgi:hypothetical protein
MDGVRIEPSGGTVMAGDVTGDRSPLPVATALAALARCAVRFVSMLARREITQPTGHIDTVLCFADGSHGRVYRDTVVPTAAVDDPVVLVVAFRLRWVRGWGHAAFRAESLLNTPLFVGFPGFVSKLWVAHDEHGRYRGVYQWNDGSLAHAYVRALWWVLALVSERDSIHYVVLPGLRRDEVVADPSVLAAAGDDGAGWWRLTAVDRCAPNG